MTETDRAAPEGLAVAPVRRTGRAFAARGAKGLKAALTASPIATLGGAIILFWAICAVLAPWLAPYPPNQLDPMALVDPFPSAQHWLGTDQLGRDILSRLLWGARTVLTVAPVAVLAAAVVGTLLGLVSGYRGGVVDALVMRVGDVMLAFPQIILYLIVITKFGASALNIVLVIAVTKAPIIARIVRAVTLDVRNRDYVAAARMRGESTLHILLVEILPNARGPLIVDIFLRLGYTTIAIGVLGFLGIGLPPPDPDWGGMIKESYGLLFVYPHMTLIPAVAVSSLVVGFNFLATGIREASFDV
ncbi:ABC transporter permease [Alsobacter sp. SYSU M60028]|uniref:ABC transporter permease n=1 Tax=Alsobacter ponti TaxID=2962936 RepID=A0ABT1L970_9HYPH|nr:ABC transporter permease [Alsobacter ponti]MCP8937989.1 ABC transporter permease [Alsobacter ponti]